MLVTGAGSGIGRASALTFAREGARWWSPISMPAAAEATVAEMAPDQGLALAGGCVRARRDRADRSHDTMERFGRIDVFFQNAGVPQAARPVEEIPLEEWNRIMAVNLTALFIGRAAGGADHEAAGAAA